MGLSRQKVNSLKQFEEFIRINDGTNHIYTSAFSITGTKENPTIYSGIDKLIYDFDNDKDLKLSKRLYKIWKDAGLPVVTSITRKDRAHIFIPFKETLVPVHMMKIILYNTAHTLLKMDKEFVLENSSVDTSVIGDVRQIIRVPETFRPDTKTFVRYMPNDYFAMNNNEIYSMLSETPKYNTTYKLHRLDFFEFIEDIESYVKIEPEDNLVDNKTTINGNIDTLRLMLRPCLFNKINTFNPSHQARVYATIDLLHTLNTDSIINLYSNLNWSDWNKKVTKKQIDSLSKYYSVSCKTISKLGWCRKDEC